MKNKITVVIPEVVLDDVDRLDGMLSEFQQAWCGGGSKSIRGSLRVYTFESDKEVVWMERTLQAALSAITESFVIMSS